jgi:hypothetical protein
MDGTGGSDMRQKLSDETRLPCCAMVFFLAMRIPVQMLGQR